MRLLNSDKKKFREYMHDKETICFGAGRYLKTFFSQCTPNGKIRCVIDNDPDKWGKMIDIDGNYVEIMPLSKLRDIINDRSMILVTASYVGVEIINTLLNEECVGDAPIFYSLFVLNDTENLMEEYKADIPENLKIGNTQVIPKIIHYAWFGSNKIPEKHQKYIDGWKRLCPDYKFILWNEHNYDVGKNDYMKQAYEQKAWGFVPDYLRKDVVYEYGGLYLDTDVEMIKKPDDLLYQQGFCGIEREYRINMGLGFGAVKKHPMLKELMDVYENEQFEYRGSKTKPSPIYETEIFKKRGYVPNGQMQIIKNMTIYPLEVLSGTSFWNDAAPVTRNTYTIHHYEGSWADKKTKARKEAIIEMYKNMERL